MRVVILMNKKLIQIKCITKCNNCNKEKAVLSLITHTKEDFPNLTYKEFFDIAENNYNKFENIIKENLNVDCECGNKAKIIEILDMQYI